MLRGDFLKTCQVLARGSSITLSLVCTRQAEFRRRMIGIRCERLLESRNGLVVSLALRLEVAHEAISVRLGRQFRSAPERRHSLFRFAGIFVGESKVVPGIRILR